MRSPGEPPFWCRPKDWVRCDDPNLHDTTPCWHSIHFHHDSTLDSDCRVCAREARITQQLLAELP